MFGDGFWVPGHHAERMAAHRDWLRAQDAQGLVVVELGAGTAVPTVRRHAELASARVRGADPDQRARAGIRHGRGVALASGARATLEAIDAALAAPLRRP